MSLLDAITEAIRNCEAVEGEVVVTGFVLVASFMDEHDQAIYCDTFEDQRGHETLGLLAHATAIETAKAAENHREQNP